jgi:hypothetical protein
MAELRVKSTGTIKLFENDNTSSVTIASPASLSANKTITLPDADVTLASGTMLATDGSGASLTALNASELGSGTVPTARLGSGTASSTTVLYGDQTYKTEPSGVALTGSTDNTIVTVTGADAIAGEAKLLFDASGSPLFLTVGNAAAEDTGIKFDGNEQDYHIALDDSNNYFEIGRGATVGGGMGIQIRPNDDLAIFAGTQTGKCMVRMNSKGTPATVSLADDASTTFSSVNVASLFMFQSNSSYASAIFWVNYGSTTVVKIADPQDVYAVADTDGKICVTHALNSDDVTIKNRLGSTKTVSCYVIATNGH